MIPRAVSGRAQAHGQVWTSRVIVGSRQSSYWHRGGDQPLLGMTIPERFAAVASRFSERDAVVAAPQRRRLTYAQLSRAGETATAEELRSYCRGKIAHYKVPRHVWFVQEFPMTVTGKLQKYRMREIAVEKMAAGGHGATQT